MLINLPVKYQYYVSMGWWVFKLLVVFILLIPGSVPLMLGYLLSVVYRFLDPNFIVFNFIRDFYRSTLGSLSVVLEVLAIQAIVVVVVVPYMFTLRKKHPGLGWVDISKAEVGTHLRKLHRPDYPSQKKQ